MLPSLLRILLPKRLEFSYKHVVLLCQLLANLSTLLLQINGVRAVFRGSSVQNLLEHRTVVADRVTCSMQLVCGVSGGDHYGLSLRLHGSQVGLDL